MLEEGYRETFDIVVSHDDIEHVPYAQQSEFMQALYDLTKPSGQLLLTTPRGETYDTWVKCKQKSLQPVEDWLTEPQLEDLVRSAGFTLVYRKRFMLYGDVLSDNKLLYFASKVLNQLGFERVEPTKFMTYQLLQLRK